MDELLTARERLGPVRETEIHASSFEAAHFQLGLRNKDQILSALEAKISELAAGNKLKSAIETIRRCRTKMEKVQSDLTSSNPHLSGLIGEYFACLSSWASGAKINPENYSSLKNIGPPVTSQELALFLQNDNVGCQTFLTRGADGSVSWGHNEEEVDPTRVNKVEWTTFTIGTDPSQITRSFFGGYQDILPGGGFSFDGTSVMAADTLLVKPLKSGGFLANTAAWILWRDGQPQKAADTLKGLAPFYDGYALNLVYMKKDHPSGEVIEFAGNNVVSRPLGDRPGNHTLQVNILAGRLSDYRGLKYMPFDEPEDESLNDYKGRQRRLKRAIHLTELFTRRGIPSLNTLKRILAIRVGESWALSNPANKAVFVGKLTPEGSWQAGIISGPAMKDSLIQEIPLPSAESPRLRSPISEK